MCFTPGKFKQNYLSIHDYSRDNISLFLTEVKHIKDFPGVFHQNSYMMRLIAQAQVEQKMKKNV